MRSVMDTAINDYGATDTCADRQRTDCRVVPAGFASAGLSRAWVSLDQGKSQSEGMAYTASAAQNLYGESA